MKDLKALLSFGLFYHVLILFSSVFGVGFLMLILGIVSIEDVIQIIGLDPDGVKAKIIMNSFANIKGLTDNILDIFSKLLNRLFDWSGVDVDLSKVDVDVNSGDSSSDEEILEVTE